MCQRIVLAPELIHRLTSGDSTAMSEIMQCSRTQLINYAAHILSDRYAAEDAVQQTYIRLWQRADTIDEGGNLAGWLRRVCHNICIDYTRQRDVRLVEPTEYIATGTHLFVASNVIADEQGRAVTRMAVQMLAAEVLKRMSPAALECVALRIRGFEYPQIAKKLNIPIGTVKSRINNGRDQAHRIAVKLGYDLETLGWDATA